jgi:hypothetical protein
MGCCEFREQKSEASNMLNNNSMATAENNEIYQ